MPVFHHRKKIRLIRFIFAGIIEGEFVSLFGYVLFVYLSVEVFTVNEAECIGGFDSVLFNYKVIFVIDRYCIRFAVADKTAFADSDACSRHFSRFRRGIRDSRDLT